MKLALVFSWFIFASTITLADEQRAQITAIDAHTQQITVTLPATAANIIYKDTIAVAVDHPHLEVVSWKAEQESTTYYHPTEKETKQVFDKDVTLVVTLQHHDGASLENACLRVTYQHTPQQKVHEKCIALAQPYAQTPELTLAIDTQHAVDTEAATSLLTNDNATPANSCQSWSDYLSHLMTTTKSLWFQILLALLLGILMSLTPCIYPMIPITVGLLQAQGSKSLGRNFLVALSYTMGVATTFSVLGLAAALTGQMFGNMLCSPVVVLSIIALLIYLAFAMFGCYEMYIPRFMQNNNNVRSQGSYLSAFAFGAASGTIASPCLSPGLVLLLSIVSALGSITLGFILLFAFGIGLSLPLLLIGTFSSSLNLLPRAGMWMIEVKKIFGFMLLALCVYFLKGIASAPLVLALAAILSCATGIYYLYAISLRDTRTWKTIKSLVGIAFIAYAVLLATKSYQAYVMANNPEHDALWLTDYEQAVAQAIQENKQLFIDIGAEHCGICNAIDATVFKDTVVKDALKNYVCLKIDGANTSNPALEKVRAQHKVIGFPTFFLVDAQKGNTLIKQWGSELYNKPRATFVQELALATPVVNPTVQTGPTVTA